MYIYYREVLLVNSGDQQVIVMMMNLVYNKTQ